MSDRPSLAVWKFASCDGCQLTLLDCEDELLAVADQLEIAYFLEASSATVAGPYDLSLVEGSITTPEDAERIRTIRTQSRTLVTIGACATAGGIQALRNFGDVGELMQIVYATPAYLSTLTTSTPISDHVTVDFELRGCPIDRQQLLEVISAFLVGRAPGVPDQSVCVECKPEIQRLRARRPGHTVPGAGHPCRMWRALSELPPGVLWVFRAGRGRERRCHGAGVGRHGDAAGRDRPSVPHLQCVGRTVPIRARWPCDRPRAEEEADMTHRASGSRALSTGALARVEGEGAMRVEVRDGELVDVQLNIYEPPRFFEGFLRGRGFEEPVDITARICGICPVAYQLSACAAIEDALGITIDEPLRQLRRLLYCGEWIESHTLHIHFLHAPDFMGYDSAVAMAAEHRNAVTRGLEIKKIGNEILEVLGGRAIHPVNVKVGGFYRAPVATELAGLREKLLRGRELAAEVVTWVATFDFPDQEMPYELVAVDHPNEYPMLGERVISDNGLDFAVAEFLDHVEEMQVPHSTALHARLLSSGDCLVGPLARYSLHSTKLRPMAAAAAAASGLDGVCRNPFRSIIVRAVEVLHAFELARRCDRRLRGTGPTCGQHRTSLPAWATVSPRPREGSSTTATKSMTGG